MNFHELHVGDYFTSYGGDVLRVIEEGAGDHPTDNFVNTRTGLFGHCGPLAPVERAEVEEIPVMRVKDDRQYEFGIGGIHDHDDPYYTLSGLEPTGKTRIVVKRGPMPHGQLWEPCSKRGCSREPVCLDCGYCENHCGC